MPTARLFSVVVLLLAAVLFAQDPTGDRWWPFLGALYLLTAVKRVRGMRLVGAIWKRKEEPARRLAPAGTTRTMMTAEGQTAIVEGPDAANERVVRQARR